MRIIYTFGIVGLIACTGSEKELQENTAPEFTYLEIAPNEGIKTSTDLLCIATATDEDDDSLSLSHQPIQIYE